MIRIMEVGPRDGLQNEHKFISTSIKSQFIEKLVSSGLKEIEVTSFVSPKWIPQLSDASELLEALRDEAHIDHSLFSVLIPNLQGLERAIARGVRRIALFTAASETFNQRNTNRSIKESLEEFRKVIDQFRKYTPGGWIRAYVSTAFECPYSGKIPTQDVVRLCKQLVNLGVNELSIGDTIGVAVPIEVKTLTHALLEEIPVEQLAYHFHDTRGTAIANVAEALQEGVTCFDSSAGGLGGCPYAPGAGGNLATEDLVYFLERSGIDTGVDLDKLVHASLTIIKYLNKDPTSKVQKAILAQANLPKS